MIGLILKKLKKSQSFFLSFIGFIFTLLILCFPHQVKANEGQKYQKIIWNYLEILCSYGPRFPGSMGYSQTQHLIMEIGNKYASKVHRQDFEFESSQRGKVAMANIELEFEGRESGSPFLLGAHYDTRPYADQESKASLRTQPIIGANDGGSGTALLLGLAHYLNENPPRFPVKLVFFDGEDFGKGFTSDSLIGSNKYVEQMESLGEKSWPFGVLVVDMVGDKDLQIFQETHSMKSAPELMERVFDIAEVKGLGQFRRRSKYSVWDDHSAFIRLDIPSIVLIDFDFPHWHKLSDTLDKCSPESLMAVFQVLTQLLNEISPDYF